MYVRRKHARLSKVIALVVVVGAVLLGIQQLYTGLKDDYLAVATPLAARDDLDAARALIDAGKPEQARALLEPILDTVDDPLITPEALLLLAAVERRAGKDAEAGAALERACREYPGSPLYPKAAVAYADFLAKKGKTGAAQKLYEEVCSSAPPELRAPALLGLGRQAEARNDLLAARTYYQQAADDTPWNSAPWSEAVHALGRVNVALIFSPEETPESKQYIVKKGDSITSIGNALNTTQGLLMRANGLDGASILNLGQQLKYTPKNFHIVIERSTCRLFLFDQDGLFKRYPVGLGKPGHETTLGAYKIGSKIKDPVWHKPGEGPIPPGDPRNELGSRWMPLVPEQEGLPRDLGIHGTIHPETIGVYSSMGCARMFPEDIEELYDLVVRSTPVDIVETYTE